MDDKVCDDMINPICSCSGCGSCEWCVTQLPPLPGPPLFGAPHEAAQVHDAPPPIGLPHEIATSELAPLPPGAPREGAGTQVAVPPMPQETSMPPVVNEPQAMPAATTTSATQPATYEVPGVTIPMPSCSDSPFSSDADNW